MLIGDLLRLSARRHPAKTAVVCGERRLSYGALDAAANRFAHAVLESGLGKGDTLAIVSRNLPEYVVAYFGAARTGCLLANLMPAYAPAELAAILERIAPGALLVEAAYEEKVAGVVESLPVPPRLVVIGRPRTPGAVAFDDFVEGRPETAPAVTLAETDPLAMTFTGGTTGLPKGAVVSHRARFVSAYTTAIEHEVTAADIVGVLTPLYHTMGLLVWLNAAVFVGATCVLLTGWDPDAFAESAERHGISCVFMVPVQLRALLDEAHFDPAKLAPLRKVACGGAITPPDLVAEVAEKLPGVLFTNHYGQSETGPLTVFKHSDPRERAGTVGRPAVGVELAVLDAEGRPAPTGETGEIVVRGPFQMDGYFDDPAETANYFRGGDGWGWTGDLGRLDSGGFVTLVGRSKDMIVSGGVNIYPREVEVVLERHEAVIECAVLGIPDETWGEALAALVVCRGPGAVGEDELIRHCTAHLARFKRPKVVRFVEAIPKTASGKVQKPRLREMFLRDLETE